jgi:hypothetical protein
MAGGERVDRPVGKSRRATHTVWPSAAIRSEARELELAGRSSEKRGRAWLGRWAELARSG